MATSPDLERERQAFYDGLAPQRLAPLWTVLSGLVTPAPTSQMRPARWRYGDIRSELMRAGELITAEEAERRVLILENPAQPGQARITSTLYAGLQLILPGEVAPCHRHTQSALRFVMEGAGAHTAVNGERVIMERFDLVLTPNWDWHDHGNESDAPMVWLDGLDIPLVTALDASFSERRGGAHPETLSAGASRARWGSNLRPPGHRDATRRAPLFHYPYAEWRRALDVAAETGHPDQHEGTILEFTNPVDGGSVMTTISAFCQRIAAGFNTRPILSTDGQVIVVVEGSGSIHIGASVFDILEGDILVVPAWTSRAIRASSTMTFFSFSDRATQSRLDLWREQRD